jgi:hypothetical protein
MSPRTKHLVKNFALSGASLGGGAALLTSAINYVKYLREKAQRDKGTDFDDSVMYVDVPLDGTTKNAAFGGGAAMTAGVLSTLGTYMVGRHLYQKMKKKKLQKDLDETQKLYWNKLVEQSGMNKRASAPVVSGERKPMSPGEALVSSPIAATLLAAVASGIITNRVLDKNFPLPTKKLHEGRPKSIRVRYTKDGKPVGGQTPIAIGTSGDIEEGDTVKTSSYEDFDQVTEADLRQSEMFLCDISLGMAEDKSYLPDLIFAVAQGRQDEIENHMTEFGTVSALEMVKGASDTTVPSTARKMAISMAINSEVLRPVVATLSAAEFMERCPNFVKMASVLPIPDRVGLTKVGAAINASELDSVIDNVTAETSTEPQEVEESELEEMSPKELMRRLIAREMEKTELLGEEESSQVDVIDSMLGSG